MGFIILHIPHASDYIPSRAAYLCADEALDAEILKLTDWYTDDLFNDGQDLQIVSKVSRLYCDVERFPYDDLEAMAPFGMGVLYDRTEDGQLMRVLAPGDRMRIMNQYYWAHQGVLAHAVKKSLAAYKRALILDCHSFSDTPYSKDLDQRPNRPDFNIGIDPFHTPLNYIVASQLYFNDAGFTLGVNRPYAGSMVPLNYYHQDDRVESIMLEVNRKLYLNPGTNEKSYGYEDIKAVLHGYITMLREMHKGRCRKRRPQ
jgi:N-formylglutamate deformylase